MYNNGGYSPKVQSMNQTSGYIHMNLMVDYMTSFFGNTIYNLYIFHTCVSHDTFYLMKCPN